MFSFARRATGIAPLLQWEFAGRSASRMTSRWQWLLRQLTRRLWFRAGLLSVLAVATALVAIVAAPYIPSDLPARIGADAVDSILNILATSMLAVTTFSLTTMVSAYSAVTSTVTPRATKLLVEDTTSQTVLATFVGSFLYSLVGIVALSSGVYGDQGRVVLFIVTLGVIALIVVTLLGWIDHLSRLGRVGETTDRVERAVTKAMKARMENPYLGGTPLEDPERDIPRDAVPLLSSRIGYVQHIDIRALSACADSCDGQIFVTSPPGAFVEPSRPLAWLFGIAPENDPAAVGDTLRAAFTIDDERSFEQDPRFGFAVLAEIASRALSPAMNDSGTAIDVIGRAVRVLSVGTNREWRDSQREIPCPRIRVPPVRLGDLFDDVFAPIARDGAGVFEVQIRLQKAFLTLARIGDAGCARHAARHARLALARAQAALAFDEEKERLRKVAEETCRVSGAQDA
jgi:uncharacterized membrane protein